MPYRLREQRLGKFNSNNFMSDERKIENEIFSYSVYKWNSNAIEWNELQMYVCADWVMTVVLEEVGDKSNSPVILYFWQKL